MWTLNGSSRKPLSGMNNSYTRLSCTRLFTCDTFYCVLFKQIWFAKVLQKLSLSLFIRIRCNNIVYIYILLSMLSRYLLTRRGINGRDDSSKYRLYVIKIFSFKYNMGTLGHCFSITYGRIYGVVTYDYETIMNTISIIPSQFHLWPLKSARITWGIAKDELF